MLDVSVQWHHSCLWDIIGFQKIISESALFCFILFEQHDCLNVEAFFFLWQKFSASVLVGSLAAAVSVHEFRVLPHAPSLCLNTEV